MPASPPLLALFFSPAYSSSSIILPRSIASLHETELTSATLCNTAPPAPRKCCAPLEQLQSSCANRKAPMRQASERLVFNLVVQIASHTTQSSCRGYRKGTVNALVLHTSPKFKCRGYLSQSLSQQKKSAIYATQ